MRFVRVDPIIEDGRFKGYSLNADGYRDALSTFHDDLPGGARAFALDDDHYDFSGPRCTHDLEIGRVVLTDANDRVSIEIDFAPNQFKHPQALSVRYENVVELSVSVSRESGEHVWPETRRLGDVLLDEVLPHPRGCSHEIQLEGGTLWIVAEDLVAEWRVPEDVEDATPPSGDDQPH